ncbi:MAG: DedA family protein [Bacteroides sp.]|nr:DedA family protein [Bacteroides sp.]MDD2645211.1 DedA family protein [Bacteroides sp.]MDD4054511.1 DedA family protein [Bacteroides sp.]MDD4719774.1 DedA family protein [Bacteroides sp.]NLI63414.1 DedA family protein [Bacteroidales bacterium]
MDTFIAFLIDWGYWGMFIASLLAGSAFPFSSEVILLGLLHPSIGLNATLCVLTATIGNTLGGMTCYSIGRAGKLEWIKKIFKVSEQRLQSMVKFLNKRSAFMAFFTFLPGLGTVIAITLGFLRSHIGVVIISMFTGKLSRYIVVAMAAKGIFSYFA